LARNIDTNTYVMLVEQRRHETRIQHVIIGKDSTSIVSLKTEETFEECVRRRTNDLEVELVEQDNLPTE